ncbi:hypothetical protein Hanom_Chr06g00499461 [Helianthus anomalus]
MVMKDCPMAQSAFEGKLKRKHILHRASIFLRFFPSVRFQVVEIRMVYSLFNYRILALLALKFLFEMFCYDIVEMKLSSFVFAHRVKCLVGPCGLQKLQTWS